MTATSSSHRRRWSKGERKGSRRWSKGERKGRFGRHHLSSEKGRGVAAAAGAREGGRVDDATGRKEEERRSQQRRQVQKGGRTRWISAEFGRRRASRRGFMRERVRCGFWDVSKFIGGRRNQGWSRRSLAGSEGNRRRRRVINL
ncbi:hypothetical protein LINGRAHAP2_LOCUS31641 [Linum grandiflorum]